MKLVGIMPVRNEAWCLGLTLRAALMWCDTVICADHGSTDSSREIMEGIAQEVGLSRLIIRDDREQEWREMEQRQMLLHEARERGATHIAIVDADEILTGNLLPSKTSVNTINAYLRGIGKGECLQPPMYQLRGSLDQYHSNGIWGNRWLSVAFQDDPRLSWSGDKFHSREPEYPGGGKLRPYQPIKQGQGGSFHLWGVSERRLKAKHALYKCVERLRWPAKATVEIERQYNLWRSPHDCSVKYGLQPAWALEWTFANVPAEWWAPYEGLGVKLVNDLTPGDLWQEAEVRRLVAEHGAETFKGLDLFGVA
jgi:hypothetical protein